MKTKNSLLIIICAFIAAPFAWMGASEAEQLFFQANVHFAEEHYAEAIPLYLKALELQPSANIHYNLGNAHYLTGNTGLARLHWEKAIAMNPRHATARIHRDMLLAELSLSENNSGFWYNFIARFSINQWVMVTALSFWAMAFLWLLRRTRKTTILGALTIPAALIFTLGLCSAWILSPELNMAIVTDSEATLRIAPTPGSPISQALTEAQGIIIGPQYGEYNRVTLSNGQEGFLRQGQWQSIRK
jgi:tetratricopeptide (TPR) repeat protein